MAHIPEGRKIKMEKERCDTGVREYLTEHRAYGEKHSTSMLEEDDASNGEGFPWREGERDGTEDENLDFSPHSKA